jgi:hypothetical protein
LKSGCVYVPVPYILTGNQTAKDIYNIDLINCSGTSAYDWVFIKAAQFWMSLIKGDVEDVSGVSNCLQNFDGESITTCGYVDDLIVAYSVGPMDGPGKTLGAASPWAIRDAAPPDANLPVTGFMQFDSADWDPMRTKGILESVVAHELGHVLGIGFLWSYLGFLNPSNCRDTSVYPLTGPVTPAPYYTGPFGNSSLPLVDPSNYQNLRTVPVEESGGEGTRCAHWDEHFYRQELMTGWVSTNGNPLSYTTALSLKDLGYIVDLNSPAIDKTFDLRTALADAKPGSFSSAESFELMGCLDHVPKGLLDKLNERFPATKVSTGGTH